ISVEPVVTDLAVAEKSDQRKIAERIANQRHLLGVGAEQIRTAGKAGVIHPAPRLSEEPFLDACKHAVHVLDRAVEIPAAEHHLLIRAHELADRDELALWIDAEQVAYQIVSGVAALNRQADEYVSADAVHVFAEAIAQILAQDVERRAAVDGE